jgi:peptidoglycan/xylan/chitin deacetylase (PgdA/CDA1 family)
MRQFKLALLHLAAFLGLFSLTRRLTAHQLRILCYHGGSQSDEHRFRPSLFMQERTFRARLAYLADQGYAILPLEKALEELAAGTLPAGAIVLTIDDGWLSTETTLLPAILEAGLPVTYYVSSYYVEKATEVFNVAAAYALWRSPPGILELSAIDPALSGTCDLRNESGRRSALDRIEHHANNLDVNGRDRLLTSLCAAVGVDVESLRRDGRFRYSSVEGLAALAAKGVDIQLHTHRHRFPADGEAARAELADNRRVLEPVAGKPLRHFCYPSGHYTADHPDLLRDAGIITAVTTDRGLVSAGCNPWLLPRVLDSDALAMVEFAAEVSGFRELLRRMGGRQPRHGARRS